jgi:hypothetical protein
VVSGVVSGEVSGVVSGGVSGGVSGVVTLLQAASRLSRGGGVVNGSDLTEHCERYCDRACESCHRADSCVFSADGTVTSCGDWECGRDAAECYADAQASEADHRYDMAREG